MLHADVLTRLMDAAATPRGLDHLTGDPSGASPDVMAHLATCDTCRAEYEAWLVTSRALLQATPDSLRAPAAARDRILSAVVREGVPRGGRDGAARAVAAATDVRAAADLRAAGAPGAAIPPAAAGALGVPPPAPIAEVRGRPRLAVIDGNRSRRASPVRFRSLALAAAAVLVVFVSGALLGTPLGLVPRDRGVASLVSAVQASDRILQQPTHREAILKAANGGIAGSVLVDPASGDIVVLSSHLDARAASDYHCYLVRDGQPGMWIGPMLTQDGTSYWAGRVGSVSDLGKSGDVIQVINGGAAPELTATF